MGLSYQSAEVSPMHHNALPFNIIVATLRVIRRLCSNTSWKVWMLQQSVAIKPLCLLALDALGDTSTLRLENSA